MSRDIVFRSLPTFSSLLRMSGEQVMIEQPHASACMMFNSSLELAHNSSVPSFLLHILAASFIVGIGSIPESAILPANTETIFLFQV